MKIKTLFGAGLVLTSLLASCSSEDLLQGNQNAGTNTLTAYIESLNDSRASISDEGKYSWSITDKISVASTSNSFETWSLNQINDDGSADFAAPDATTTANEGDYAVFPETLNPTVSGNSLQITLPAEYESNKTVPILIGKYNDGKVDFAHAGGLIRISFDNVPSYANKFVFSTNNQNIAGNFTIDDNQAINTSAGTNSKITINIAGNDIKDGKITFDVPVPVGTYEGFSVGLYCNDEELASQSTTKSNTIERRDLLVMPTIKATDYFAGSNYVVEKVSSYSSDEETYILESEFDLSQVSAIYVDGVKLSEVVSSYQFSDSESHTVIIAMNDNFNNASCMFKGCSYIDSFDFSNFDTSNVTDMSGMFSGCTSIKTLDLSHFDTSKVTNMSSLVSDCTLLKTIDLSKFDIGEVADMSYMFYGCTKLTSLDLSNFKTNKVTDTSHMFEGCTKLSELDISNLVTTCVTNMSKMFYNCNVLTSLDLSKWDTSNVTDMTYLFGYCNSLTSLDLSNFNTRNVLDMSYLFFRCRSLTSLDLSKWDASNVTTMDHMFESCDHLSSLKLPYKTSKLVNIGRMVRNCTSLTSLDLSNIETKWVTDMNRLFDGCKNLTKIIMIGDVSRVSNSDDIVGYLPSSGTFYYPEEYKDEYEEIFFSQSELDGWTKIAQ